MAIGYYYFYHHGMTNINTRPQIPNRHHLIIRKLGWRITEHKQVVQSKNTYLVYVASLAFHYTYRCLAVKNIHVVCSTGEDTIFEFWTEVPKPIRKPLS